jgi:hypothetical protein
MFLKCVCFQLQPGGFIQPEQQVHILNGLPRGSFQEIVEGRMDHQVTSHLLQLDQAFIGIDHLLQRNRAVAHDGERVAP